MPEELMEVQPSEDNGNVPIEAPKEEPTTETPAKVEETVEPTVPTEGESKQELYDLPDGRKVSGEEVAEEYKKLLSDYTRKSQELAKLSNNSETLKTNEPTEEKNYADPEWVPQTYAEIIELAKQEALRELEGREQAKIAEREAIENLVVQQLTEIKAVDPNVNENALFLHANKYGFRDLKLAHQNMKDMSEMIKKVQTTTAQNVAKRNDPVSVSHGAGAQKPDPSMFSTARDFIRSLK